MVKHPFHIIGALCALAVVAISIPACTKDYFNFDRLKEDFVTWEPDIAFPIVYSIIGAEDIIGLSDSTNIYEYDADNFITLIYSRRVFSQTMNDFFQLPQNQGINSSMSLTPGEIGTFIATGQVPAVLNTGMTVALTGPGNSQLDKLRFQSGSMNISFTSTFEHSGSLLVVMPEMRFNGTPFSQTYPIDFQGGATSFNIDVPLQGYEMDLDNGGGSNTIPISYTLVLNQGGGAVPTPVDQVQISHTFENMMIAFADGYFGNFELVIDPSEVDLDVLQSEHGGSLYFQDPRFLMRIRNTLGAKIEIAIDELYATGDQGQQNVNTSTVIPGNQFTIDGAPAMGDSTIREYYFTKDNSNIKEIINGNYDMIYHDFSATVNPDGQTYNFAGLNSAIEVTADVELPFWGYSDHFTIIDTVEVPFDEAEDFADNVERGLIRISTVSHFPVDGTLKLYFADSAYNLIDSVLTDGSYLIQSGRVEQIAPDAYKVVESTITNNDVPLDTVRIRKLFDSKYLLVATDITTTDDAGKNIRIYKEDGIEIRVGIQVKLKASPSDMNGL